MALSEIQEIPKEDPLYPQKPQAEGDTGGLSGVFSVSHEETLCDDFITC